MARMLASGYRLVNSNLLVDQTSSQLQNCIAMVSPTSAREHRRSRLALLSQAIGQTRLSEITGVSAAYIYQMSSARGKNARPVNDEVAAIVEGRLGLSPGWLDRNDPVPAFELDSDAPQERRIKVRAYQIRAVDGDDGIDPSTDAMIPVYDISVSGGNGIIVPEFVETKYRLPYQIDWLNRWSAKPEDILIAKVIGGSMEPILWHGDKAVIHRGRREVARDGLVYSLIYGDEARVKRLYRLADGSLRINSANPDKDQYPDEIISVDDLGSIHIIGQVIDKMGSGGLGF